MAEERGMVEETVTRSCGCVFCDLELKPTILDGKPYHVVERAGVLVVCRAALAERER